jgi:fructokinase
MLGRSVTPLLRLGTDAIGAKLKRDLHLAGADTRLIARRQNVRSPVIIELLDPASNDHRFSVTCPHSSERFGTFQPITPYELEPARPAIDACTIFFADRLSNTICDAMEAASAGGAIIFFEPSSLAAPALFERALSIANVFKYSVDRLSPEIAASIPENAFSIVTLGSAGLELRHGGEIHHCAAAAADVVKDACGSGDMVTLGLIDTILQSGAAGASALSLETVLAGVQAGQRLAAANCAYVGARGLFRERGAAHARSILAATPSAGQAARRLTLSSS